MDMLNDKNVIKSHLMQILHISFSYCCHYTIDHHLIKNSFDHLHRCVQGLELSGKTGRPQYQEMHIMCTNDQSYPCILGIQVSSYPTAETSNSIMLTT